MDPNLIEILYVARRDGVTGLDLSDQKLDLESGHDLQLAVLDRFLKDGDGLAGWKISYTAGNARDRMGLGFRPFGYLLRSRTLASGSRVALSDFANAAIEPELCLEIGSPLRGEVGIDEARAAVRSVLPAFELNESRSASGADNATIVADGCNNWGIVSGVGVATRGDLTETTVELWNDNEQISTSTPKESMDDPYLSLSRLSAKLAEHGRYLDTGQRVITGSFSRAVVTEPGLWKAVFQNIGEVVVEFT
jgi:2-keto-4-pentenoate hydratase